MKAGGAHFRSGVARLRQDSLSPDCADTHSEGVPRFIEECLKRLCPILCPLSTENHSKRQ